MAEAKKENSDLSGAIIDKAYPVKTIVKNQAGDKLKVKGASFRNGTKNI